MFFNFFAQGYKPNSRTVAKRLYLFLFVIVCNPIANPTVTTTYILKKQQCSVITYDTVKVTLNIACPTPSVDIEPQDVIVPNVFSPNADNVNDTFKIELRGSGNVSFAIYNRWGNLIFEVASRASATEILWVGRTTSGEPCSEGVYFYTLKYADANGEQQTRNGYVSLFR